MAVNCSLQFRLNINHKLLQISVNGFALFERTAGKCSCRFCPADSGAAGTYTADESKMTLPHPPKGNDCVVTLGHKISHSSAKLLPPGIWRTSTWKSVHQATVGPIARDRAEGRWRDFSRHRHSWHSSWRFSVQPILSSSQPHRWHTLNLTFSFQQDGDPSHWGHTQRESPDSPDFQTDRLDGTDQSRGPLVLPI